CHHRNGARKRHAGWSNKLSAGFVWWLRWRYGGCAMSSRDVLWFLLASICIAAVWEAVSWAYGLSDEQAGGVAPAVTCVSTFLFIAWKEWRSKKVNKAPP